MELNKKTYLRRHLEQQPTMELEELLQTEIRKEEPEEELVRILLQVLEERHQKDLSELQINSNPAWEKYKKEKASKRTEQNKKRRSMVQIAAVLAVVFTVVFFAMPQLAKADSWIELITRWSAGFFEIFEDDDKEYVFASDNPGLQQVYDAVVEMGVDDPVVPMWLEDAYELVELEETTTPAKSKVYARLYNGENTMALTVTIYYTETAHEVHKDEVEPKEYECGGIDHYISHNSDTHIVVWTRENIACTLSVDCREETFYKILESIYTTEVS